MVGGEKERWIARLAGIRKYRKDSGRDPEFEETARKMVERTISLHRKLKAEQKQG